MALATEGGLKQAEREFRNHDRKVHRIAKQRLAVAVSGRESRAAAQGLLARTAALIGDELVALNHVAALDREWQALPAALLEPEQRARFTELRAHLDTVVRERADAQQRVARWRVQAEGALPAWQRGVAAAAGGADLAGGSAAIDLNAIAQAVQALQQARPEVPATEALEQTLTAVLQACVQVQAQRASVRAAAAQGALLAATAAAPPLPAPAPAPAAVWAPAQRAQVEALLQQAEAALAEGQLGELQRHLSATETFLAALGTAVAPKGLQARHQALYAERDRLKGWQKWGGGRAREDLVCEAEAMAMAARVEADTDAPARPKLNLKLHGESLQVLRLRWKELDRLDAPAKQALWQRFDAALTAAFEPVAAQHAVHKAARQDNLQAREALLATLQAVAVPGATALAGAEAAAWRQPQRELERFQQAWRKLGPLEYTVPARARDGLLQRLGEVLDRIEPPLQEACRVAGARREHLIARAQALVPGGGRQPLLAEIGRQVRELQAEWQDQARQLPLPRAVETSLWARFRAATDAVFAQREAAHAAREAGHAAALAGRAALLARRSALDADTPVAEIERTLADVDRAWQARCDALAARLALCEAREAGAADAADLGVRWAALDALPAEWAQPLAQRWAGPVEPGPLGTAEVDDLLLRWEAALDLPAAPEWQDARRKLKLRALKDCLEGRVAHSNGPAARAVWLRSVLRQSGLAPAQRARLQGLLAALRAAGPLHFGAAGSAMRSA